MTQTMSMKVESKKHCESIHSGQFMVSHIEQEPDEYQDYPADDDDECEEMPAASPLGAMPSTSSSSNICLQLERYKPEKRLSDVYEIDSDLSKIFDTLNVTYKQKLTSPKWNPFKGIKLRWKEKIRLNNVIWRCWHMQFIMKKRPLVCQFASPLDVDIHNTPQAIILEGKYWKRKWKVITAEYKKWRRFNVNKALGSSITDTKSEIDLLEWSTNDNLLMTLSDNMSSDTLFSTISQFPFPDSREIARGASRSDFIQPSLGPLQPNFEDFMDFDLDIFNTLTNNRLAPVPEEQTEELLKAIEFPMISSMDASNMQSMLGTNPSTGHQSVIQGTSSMNVNQQVSPGTNQLLYTATIYTQDMSNAAQNNQQQQMMAMHEHNRQQQNESSAQALMSDLNPFISGGMNMNQQSMGQSVDSNDKDAYKNAKFNRYMKAQLPKREPHNYDKCQPTAHQTTVYNQMLAQQQDAPQLYNNTNAYGTNLGDLSNINHLSPIQTTTNNFKASSGTLSSQNVLNLSNNQMSNYTNKMMMQQQQQMNQMSLEQQQQQQQQQQSISTTHDSYKSPQSPSYRYHHGSQHGNQPYKIPSQNAGYTATSRIMMRQQSPPHHSGSSAGKSMSFQQQNATVAAIKEMYRSNSLPINANILLPTKEAMSGDNFVVPKYPQAAKKERRSSAANIRQGAMQMPPLQSANSEPALNVNNSALAQLLTNSGSLLSSSKAHSVSSSAMSSSVPPQPVRANSFTSSSLVQNSIMMATNAISGQQRMQPQQQQQPASSTTSGSGIYTPTLSPDSAFQDSHDVSSHSPERCLSLGKYQPRESQRRAGHIHAEQKRRYNIKNGFDMLHSLIPQLQQNPNAKLSKASMLHKGAEYIRQLRTERAAVSEQMDSLKKEIEQLTSSLNHLQNALPANGAPVSRQRTGRVRELYHDYVLSRTMGNWKFWIFGQLFEPLLNSYNTTVSTANMDELSRTTMLWIDNSCSLMEVRPAVSNKLREISTTTDILSDNPTSLQEEVLKAVKNMKSRSHHEPR